MGIYTVQQFPNKSISLEGEGTLALCTGAPNDAPLFLAGLV